MAIAPDTPVPGALDIAFSLATDDLMVFSDSGPGGTTDAVERFEAALLSRGAVKHPGKDVNDETSAICVGIDLVDGTDWWPPSGKMVQLLQAVVDLSRHRSGSPAGVGCFLGVTQWYDLLRRLKLSVFHNVYAFSADWNNWERGAVPGAVVQELLLDAVCYAFIGVDMRKPFLPFVGATDASTVYGHGAAVAPLPLSQVRQLARLSSKEGDHVVLDGVDAGVRAARGRLGQPHQLGLALCDFEVVLSVRVSEPDHINLEEARALLRYVRWLLRSVGRFGHRAVVLVDSRVVVGACTKGRSGSVPLNRLIQRLAALCFAGGLDQLLVYIPSAHNPSDPPSRGPRETWPRELRTTTRHGVEGGVRHARRAAARAWHDGAALRAVRRSFARLGWDPPPPRRACGGMP